MNLDCSSCSKDESVEFRSSGSILGVLLVAIIPKCPVCIMAYTGAITMCSGEQFLTHSNNWVSYLPLFIAIGINGLIIFNPKGKKTFWALPFSLSGLLLVILAHQMILPAFVYEIGTVLLFVGVGLNSNWRSVWHQLRTFKTNPVISYLRQYLRVSKQTTPAVHYNNEIRRVTQISGQLGEQTTCTNKMTIHRSQSTVGIGREN